MNSNLIEKIQKILLKYLEKLLLSPLENRIIVGLFSTGIALITIPLYSLSIHMTYKDFSIQIFNDEKILFLSILIGIIFVFMAIYIFLKYKPKNSITGIKFINSKTIIDIKDEFGKIVEITEYQKLKSLVENKYTIIEPIQSDGYIDDDKIKVTPGIIEKIKRKEGLIYISSNFGKPLKKNEILERTFFYVSENSFISDDEYWVSRNSSETKNIKIIIKFPKGRKYISFIGYQQYLSYDEIYKIQPKETIIDNRNCLIWELDNIDNTNYSYRLEWKW